MPLPQYRVLDVADHDLQRVQAQILPPLSTLLKNPLLDGRLVRGVNIPAVPTTTDVAHGLGRLPVGWFVLQTYGGYNVLFENSRTDKMLNMVSIPIGGAYTGTGLTTFDLWIF